MSATVVHAVFHLERQYAATPRRVFQAFADPVAKALWFAGTPDKWQLLERVMDFRVGGRERLRGKWAGGQQTTFDAVYHDIIPEQRIIYSYDMFMDARKLSVSLATIQMQPAAGGGTHLKVSEQGAFLDGYTRMPARGNRERGRCSTPWGHRCARLAFGS